MNTLTMNHFFTRTRWAIPALIAWPVLLGLGLGERALTGSENRWAEIARNMIETGDAFHPIINGIIYFDKPLASYWLVVGMQWVTGSVDELTARLPSVLAGVLLLWCVYHLTTQLWNRRAGWLALWLTVTCYGFLFWAHTAAADLVNAAFTLLAVTCFFQRRNKPDLLSYTLFHVICAVGSQMKGLTAWVVPCLIIAPYVLRDRRWRAHLNINHLLGLLIGLAVYTAPYTIAASTPLPPNTILPQHGLGGFELVIRENIVRFLQPFDHKDPIYSYIYQVPRILFPWSLLFMVGFYSFARRYRALNSADRWLLESIILVFIFFTLSGSRRWYYILPIMPLCLMQLAVYLTGNEAQNQRLRSVATVATTGLLMLFALALAGLPAIAWFKEIALPGGIAVAAALALFGSIGLWGLQRWQREKLDALTGQHNLPSAQLLTATLSMVLLFGIVLPALDSFRQEKPFALALAKQVKERDKVVFFKHANETVVFYLHHPEPIPVVDTPDELAAGPPPGENIVIIAARRDFPALWKQFPSSRNAKILAAYQPRPWDKQNKKDDLVAYRLNTPAAGDFR